MTETDTRKSADEIAKLVYGGPTDSEGDQARIDQFVANYKPATDLATRCGTCSQFVPPQYGGDSGSCALVAGLIRTDYVCDLYDVMDDEDIATRIGNRDPDYDGSWKPTGAVSLTAKVAKTDDEHRIAFGWASVAVSKDGQTVIDSQGDEIDVADLEDAAYVFNLSYREADDSHSEPVVGRLIESVVFTPAKKDAMGIAADAVPDGWWVGFYVDDDATWEKVKDGTYSMFSIGGIGTREEVSA